MSRSEGYELSVSNRMDPLTNQGQNLEEAPETDGSQGNAVVTKNLFFETRPSENAAGTYDDPDYDELFFFVQSECTGTEGFDVLLGNLPEGTRAYRAESGTRREEVEIPFGDYEKHLLYDEAGNPVYE